MDSNTTPERLTSIARRFGAHRAAVIETAVFPFRREFREACAQNACGKYGKCWMCPPDVGDIDEMIARAKEYGNALIFQTIHGLEDSFDIEGMQEAAKKHNRLALTLAGELDPLLKNPIRLGGGACHVCDICARVYDEQCRYPEKAVASLESYGVAVSELASLCGMKYMNGPNTVTYFGGFLYNL